MQFVPWKGWYVGMRFHTCFCFFYFKNLLRSDRISFYYSYLLFHSEVVLDVREKAIADLHPLQGAKSVPLSQLRARLPDLDKSKHYTTVCLLFLFPLFHTRLS